MTGSTVRNFTAAQIATEKLNKEFEDGCINPLSMIDMYAFNNGMSKILDGSINVRFLGKIVFGLQIIALVSSGIYYFVCIKFPYEEDKEHCKLERKRKEALIQDEEAKRETETATQMNS